jgi:hypothetical protein
MPHPRFNNFHDLINYLFDSFKEEIEENKNEYESWEEQYEDMLNYRINDYAAWAYYGFELDFSASEICFMFQKFNDCDFEINWDNTRDAELCNLIIYYAWRDCAEDIEEYGKELWGITENF